MAILNSSVSVGLTSTTVLNTNDAPMLIIMCNDSDTDIYVSIWDAAVLNKGILLNASGGSITIDTSSVVVQKIYAISSWAAKRLTITTV